MSVLAYFNKRTADPRMPRTEPGQPDPLGITWSGPVSTGQLGVRQAIDLDVARARNSQPAPPAPKRRS